MTVEEQEMKPIWYFVGWVLLAMGGLIFLTGLYLFVSGTAMNTVLEELHPDLWWGAIMTVVGLLFLLTSRKPASKE